MLESKILIVEDEAIAAMDIQQRLAALGYPLPNIAYNGEEGVKKAEELQPDLVLMDIMMPGKFDGIAAAEQIRSRFDIPIIFLTAYTDEKTLSRAKITAPYGYIVKPFQERELHITVDMALNRHKMERELREREKWLATTLRSIGDAVIATDEKGLITFLNPVAEALTGYKPEEALQKNLAEVFNIINRDTRKPVEDPVARVILEGNIVGLANHTVLISRDGKEIPINDSAAPIKDDHGNILGVILVFSDVSEHERFEEALSKAYDEMQAANAALLNSRRAALNLMEDALAARKLAEEANVELLHEVAERKQSQEALRESEERFRSLTENSPDCIALHDSELRHIYVNPAIVGLVGLPQEAFTGKTVWEMGMPSEAAAQLDSLLRQALETGQKYSGELIFPTPGGERFFNWRSVPILSAEGTIRAVLAIAGDITVLKQAEGALLASAEQLMAQNMELENVNRELEAFIYSVSHDLRAPLRTMSGFAKILVEDYTGQLDEQGRDYLARISRGSAKMSRLIEDLLDLSKISKQELRAMEIDLSKLASNLASGLREANPERNVDIVIEEGLKARVDKPLMEIVLSNLLGNAWKFTSKTDKARIEFGVIKKEIGHMGLMGPIYFVRDNGAGFNAEYKDKMFGPFQRLHSEKEFPGTGIGLTIVERIIRRHGGKVWAEGGAGEGAVIYFTLG